jgi:hypothetical protein
LTQSAYDVGIIGLQVPVGNFTGWLGMAAGDNAATSAYALGYPGAVGASTPGTGLIRQDLTASSNNTELSLYWR